MSSPYHAGARRLQDRFDTRRLADRLDERFLSAAVIGADDRAFIERMDMFFLATADDEGRPQCSYKGGDPGFVRVLDEHTLAFPNYDGNGMYLSMGNVVQNGHVGLLFIDFICGAAVATAGQRCRADRRIGRADRRLPGRAVRRPRGGDAGVPELPALHPPHGPRRALAVRAARRPRHAGARLEADGLGLRRAARGRPGARALTPRPRPAAAADARPGARRRFAVAAASRREGETAAPRNRAVRVREPESNRPDRR